MKKQTVDLQSCEFTPKSEYVLVVPTELQKEKLSDSGIVLVYDEDPMERPTYGEVQAYGEDIKDLEVGQMVLWPNTDGLDLEFTDGHRILLRYKSIIGMKKI